MDNRLPQIAWQKLAKKCIFWGVWLLILAVLQTSFFSAFKIFGMTPSLVLAAVLAIAVHDRERSAVITGITGGFLVYALGGAGIAASVICYMIYGTVTAVFTATAMDRSYPSWLLFAAAFFTIDGIIDVVISNFIVSEASFSTAAMVFKLIIPQTLSSLVAGTVVYILTTVIWKYFFDNREMTG